MLKKISNHRGITVKSTWQNIVSSKINFFRDASDGLLAILKLLMKFAEGENE